MGLSVTISGTHFQVTMMTSNDKVVIKLDENRVYDLTMELGFESHESTSEFSSSLSEEILSLGFGIFLARNYCSQPILVRGMYIDGTYN